jgi:hypothetical protein
MAYRRQKISQMNPKGANLQATDLLEVSVLTGTGYDTYSITGQQIINAGGGGGSQNLQQVTDIGSTTTNSITITSGVNEATTVSGIDIRTENTLANTHVTLRDTGEIALRTGGEESSLQNTNVSNPGVILEFPDKATGSYTIATEDDLINGYVPYTGATANVDLGTFHLDAAKGTFTHSGSTDTLTANHTSGSGIGLLITKGGANEGLKVIKTSGSGNAATIIGTLEATTIVKTGGTSTEFLMADGSTSLQYNQFPLFGAAMGNVIGAATPVTRFFAFLGLTANTAENQRQIPVPYAVTFKNFFCFFGVGASQPASGSLVLTIRKNGVDTAITITIPAGSSIGTYSDTTNSESFAAGDLISVKAVNNAISVASGNITSLTLGTI